MKKIWFFDLDGTLADTDPDIRSCWRKALDEMRLVAPTFERDFVAGPPIEVMLKQLLPDVYTDELAAELRRRFGALYDGCGFPLTREYPGVMDAVRALRRAGAKTYILTNKRYAGATAMAAHFGWGTCFDDLYAGDRYADDPQIGKMHKTALLAWVLKHEGVDPAECTLVGDTLNDFAAAKANGVESVGVVWGYGRPDELAQADRLAATPAEIH